MVDVVATLQHAIEVVVLADLSADLADAKLELANLKVEMATFTSENLDLKTQLSAKIVAKAKLDKGAYVLDEEGHFCTACFDVRHQRVRVSELPPAFRELGTWQCPSCQAVL